MLLEETAANALVDGVSEVADQVSAGKTTAPQTTPQCSLPYAATGNHQHKVNDFIITLGHALASRCVLGSNSTSPHSIRGNNAAANSCKVSTTLPSVGVSPAGALSMPRPASC